MSTNYKHAKFNDDAYVADCMFKLYKEAMLSNKWLNNELIAVRKENARLKNNRAKKEEEMYFFKNLFLASTVALLVTTFFITITITLIF